jgi:hypothetical protein
MTITSKTELMNALSVLVQECESGTDESGETFCFVCHTLVTHDPCCPVVSVKNLISASTNISGRYISIAGAASSR